ncbi:thioesterase family protein [Streptomyces sp. NPDC086554]|uniref:acyl-CoA thioesterase n=1 Tax=Streptomyces sp. NPDC086554 TaxID=3154864 RepID=UPI0034396B4D
MVTAEPYTVQPHFLRKKSRVPSYTYPCPLRWADADAYGHVNNALFLRFMEEARTRMFHAMLAADEAERHQHAFDVSQSIVDYRAPLVYRNEPVDVTVWVVSCRGARLELGYMIQDPERTYAEATTKLAAYNLDTGRPRRISEAEIEFFARYTPA